MKGEENQVAHTKGLKFDLCSTAGDGDSAREYFMPIKSFGLPSYRYGRFPRIWHIASQEGRGRGLKLCIHPMVLIQLKAYDNSKVELIKCHRCLQENDLKLVT